jgi:hypothetical protein
MATTDEIIARVKQKKELSGLTDAVVSETISNYLKKKSISLEYLNDAEKKLLVKDIRAELRHYSGRFQKDSEKRLPFVKSGNISELLKTHSSTRERVEFYPEIRKLLGELKVKSILDLGCGINPVALATRDVEYYASDINEENLQVVSKFFQKNNLNGKTFVCDLKHIDLCTLPKTDICFLFKVFDVLETKGHKLAEKIIILLHSTYLLISFSTKTLSGKPMNHPQRGWIELLLSRLDYKFSILKSKNEIFYLARKS